MKEGKLKELKSELRKEENKKRAKILSKFFKTGKGEYGEGDIFLGIKVPVQRKIAERYNLDLEDIQELLNSKIHEFRSVGLFLLIKKFKESDEEEKENIFNFYLKNSRQINNWDLVDLSANKIIGEFLLGKEREVLYNLADSENLWERRISVISCFSFIKENDFRDALNISEILIKDRQDLINKAVGWMLREIGKRNQDVLVEFLNKNYKVMPRVMLRYATEKFDEDKRKFYLGKIAGFK